MSNLPVQVFATAFQKNFLSFFCEKLNIKFYEFHLLEHSMNVDWMWTS